MDDSIPRELRQQTKYRIVRLLGRGGMGSVYEAHHERMDRRQALKVLNPELVDNPQALSRFEEEVKAVAKLDHPNIARAYDAESFGSLQAIVMEFVAGQTLHEFLKKRGRLSVVEACRCVRQACLGLQHAHERGIVHRDLKPQNLMLTQDTGIIKILDFGLAKVVSENKAARGLTKTNMTMGTYEYTAPEQAIDAASADIRADIYSLGCTLYYLIAGVLPFVCNSDVQLLLAHQNETPRPLCEVCPETPQELSDLVDRMLAKSPADRPQTPGEVAKALLPFAKGEIGGASISPLPLAGEGPGVRAGRAAGWTRALAAIPPRFRTRGWLVAAGGAAFAGIVLLGVLIMMRTPDGTLIVDVSDPDAIVQVFDAQGKVVIERKAGSEKVEISVVPGKGKLCVKQKGFELFTTEFSLASGGRETIKAKLMPLTGGGTPIVGSQSPIPPPADDNKSPASDQAAASLREVDLLKLLDPAKDAVSGNWSFADGALVCEPSDFARIEIPYDPPEEYDYRIAFVPTHLTAGVEQICRGGGRQFRFTVGGWGNTIAGFSLISGKNVDNNPTTTKADHWFVAGQRHVSVVKVRKDGVEGWFDGKRVVGYKTDWTDMSLLGTSKLRRPDSIGIVAWPGVRVESAKIIEITGKGRYLRPPPVADESSLPWRDLFDGKTLDGWDGDPRLWSVQDGAITGETTEENRRRPTRSSFGTAAGPPISNSRPSSGCPIRASPTRGSRSAVGKVRAGGRSAVTRPTWIPPTNTRALVMARISATA